ncbi:MAG TPA: hypothetical protein VE842_00235 [Pyrinomonadaceae bacterium]|jgi:hypothetical protein|nr:hypothetical protein [Pyrinomonadaceae bacterium]
MIKTFNPLPLFFSPFAPVNEGLAAPALARIMDTRAWLASSYRERCPNEPGRFVKAWPLILRVWLQTETREVVNILACTLARSDN